MCNRMQAASSLSMTVRCNGRLLCLYPFIALVCIPALASTNKAVSIPVFNAPPVIDGRLDETIWMQAQMGVALTQVFPAEGNPPSVPIEVFLGHDAENIYFAVEVAMPISDLTASRRGRDADLEGDDYISLIFDPFGSQRDGYRFRFNPIGTKEDALIEEVNRVNAEWDCVWWVETVVSAQGWTAEGRIPLQSIGFNPQIDRWGFNVEQVLAKRNEQSRWTAVERSLSAESLADIGSIVGLMDLRQGLGLRFEPYVLAEFSTNDASTGSEQDDFDIKSGFELYYRPIPSITATLTVNTDFAETEVDDRVIELSRFPTFFPEKRGFFLEDSGIFSFGGIEQSPLPFFSRRIGVGPDGIPVDIPYGFKLAARTGNVPLGALNVYVEEGNETDAQHLSVARATVDILEESYVGIIGTRGNPQGVSDNYLIGADFRYRDSDFGPDAGEITASAWIQYTDTEDRDQLSIATGWDVFYNSRYWLYSHFAEYVGPGYFPALGFVRQNDIAQGDFRVVRAFFPENWDSIELDASVFARYEMGGRYLEYVNASLELWAYRMSGAILSLGSRLEHEELREAFEPVPGLLAQPGSFSGAGLFIRYETSKAPSVSGFLEYEHAPFYGGTIDSIEGSLSWRGGSIFECTTELEVNKIDLLDSENWLYLWRSEFKTYVLQNVTWANIIQYDSISREMGFNSRLRWNFRPGSDIYLVVNHRWLNDVDQGWDSIGSRLNAKLSATLSF